MCLTRFNTTNTMEESLSSEGQLSFFSQVLTDTKDYKMYLSNDIYSFYAQFPVIPATQLLPLPTASPKHYQWGGLSVWYALHQDVTSSQVNIPILTSTWPLGR